MTGCRMPTLSFALVFAAIPGVLAAQSNRDAGPKPLEIGATAPDFSMKGATRYGVLANPVRLSDFKGKTVVLAFFYKARTKG
jgi:peroxiredoxin Q/BCP